MAERSGPQTRQITVREAAASRSVVSTERMKWLVDDAERRNSIYKLVLSSRRRSMTNNNLKAVVFLYHNQRLSSGALERNEVEEDSEEDMEDTEV